MDKYIISMYGAGKFDKVKTNLKNGTEESKRRFIKKYPYANLNKFEFQVDLDKDGDIDGTPYITRLMTSQAMTSRLTPS